MIIASAGHTVTNNLAAGVFKDTKNSFDRWEGPGRWDVDAAACTIGRRTLSKQLAPDNCAYVRVPSQEAAGLLRGAAE